MSYTYGSRSSENAHVGSYIYICFSLYFAKVRRRIHRISISITPTIELVLLGKWSLCCVREKRTFGQTTVHSAPRGSHASRSLECRPSVTFRGVRGLRERTGLIAQFSEMRFLEQTK